MSKNQAKPKIFLQSVKIAVLAVGLALVIFSVAPTAVDASGVDPAGEMMNSNDYGNEMGRPIDTKDAATKAAVKKSAWERIKDQLTTWQKELTKDALKKAGAIAYKRALKYFLDTLAYDMATYLATGDKGQLPMFQTEGWGGYLKNVADNTAGSFIEQLGKNFPIKFNLCNPDLRVMLRINLGLMRTYRPPKPACTFSEMTKNWDTALRKKDFLNSFQDMFNPWSNDLGIALTLHTGISSQIDRDINTAINTRQEGGGFKAVTEPISGAIKTPGNLVREAAGVPLKDASAEQKLYTGSIVADSIDIFINTLAGKLIERWLRGGLVTKFPTLPNKLDSLASLDAQNQPEGVAGAKDRLRAIVEPNFKVRADYDILAELTTCPDPNKAGPTNCVIDEKFRQAIEKKMTVGQALKEGYLNGDGIFGFTADGLEPKLNEQKGYPYRSMIILRKYRIIPVGWEVAAQKIKDLQGSGAGQVDGTKNLKDLVDCFSGDDEYGAKNSAPEWCVGLVDPDWVLKAPQNFCKREGAGPEIISEQVTGDGSGSSLSILRNDTYCADEQSVITEKSDGSPVFGYCTAERRKWDFNAKGCTPRSNTCQTFGSSSGQTNSYLENTLDFSNCNLGNAGCQKYALAQADSYDAAAKTVGWSNQAIYLNRQAETCDVDSEGCHGFIRITPGKDETYDSIENKGVKEAYDRFKPAGLIHEKLLPDYLMDSCYEDKISYYQPKDGAPALCSSFARKCTKQEAGCELYTNVAAETKVPGKVKPEDYCPAACVGYNAFVQSETVFDSSRDAYFIPKTAKTCSADASGCDEFTNLEKVTTATPNVAEQKEYYTYLRQCVKPDTLGETCGEFYNWEGSDESGFQLKVESLKLDDDTDDASLPAWARYVGDPAVSSDDSGDCSETIYNLPTNDPAYNSDCRQFYSRSGGVSYHLYSRTITCSDDCHPYRKTDSSDQNCKGGGAWDSDNNACLYSAVPGQGVTCSAQAKGCREYAGNTGNDVRNIFTDDFEADANAGPWQGNNGSTVTRANESVILQNNAGHSMLVSVNNGQAGAKRPVGNAVSQGRSYTLSFLAKATSDNAKLDIALVAGAVSNPPNPLSQGGRAEFAKVENVNTGWQIKKTNLINLNHEVSADEYLLIKSDSNFYIDNITLTEITDRFYLIKNSWRTPEVCYNDMSGALQGPAYNLGCDQYKDRAGKTHNLRQFSELCPESAVGCELLIDTHNSSDPAASFYQDGQKIETPSGADLPVPADDFAYAVYDPEKLCGAEEKGCERLGQAYQYDKAALYSDVYLKNNPDKYGQILCGSSAVGCEVFAYDKGAGGNGEKYFKDPGDMVCEWRQETEKGLGQGWGWFKKKVKRCGGNAGAVCLTDKDCLAPAKCLLETDNKSCPTSVDKTFGLGGAGNRISQPTDGWAGTCAAEDSGCTEYIDPMSKFNTNIIFNGSFQTLASGPTDGWTNNGNGSYSQTVTLEPYTIYRLARAVGAGHLTLGGCSFTQGSSDKLYQINSSNKLEAALISIDVPSAADANSRIFYYQGGTAVNCVVTVDNSNGAVELKKAAVDYQLRGNLDRQSCNGQVNSGQGCVLFNERKTDGAGLAALTWDADTGNISGTAAVADKDSNVILKVAPDRVCDKWLACKSYIKDQKGDNVCFDIGLCDAVDANGNCQSFITSKKENQLVESLTADGISNLSGYAKVGISGGSLINDYYPFGAMEQKGELANFANGGFEYYGSNLYPIGWSWGNPAANKSWDANVFSVINNPIAAQTEGIGYAREGAAFLKLGSSYDAVSEQIDVIPDKDYIITAYVNTKNLKSGQAKIDILDKDDNLIAGEIIKQKIGNDWNFQIGKFKTGASVSQIKIKLYASLDGGVALKSSEGNFYYDDIKIRPALNSRIKEGDCWPGYCISDNGGNNGHCSNKSQNCLVSNDVLWYAPQSCRLYPQTDSLACDYYESSGKRQKGWYGYCLEYDRRPGDPNTCLLWYPIDKVKGDGIEEGAGYADKAPVYYCLEGQAERAYEYRHVFFNEKAGDNCSNSCPTNYQLVDVGKTRHDGPIDENWCVCEPIKADNDKVVLDGSTTNYATAADLGNDTPSGIEDPYFAFKSSSDGWYKIDGSLENLKGASNIGALIMDTNPYASFLCSGTTQGIIKGCPLGYPAGCACVLTKELYRSKVSCTKVVQTVTPTGQNKYWSSRVYKGSDYTVPGLGYEYGADAAPFGSMVPPPLAFNPYDWDGEPNKDGFQPISYSIAEGMARLGKGYGCSPSDDCGFVADNSSQDNFPYAYVKAPPTPTSQTVSELVKRLFAQSYGFWNWTGTSVSGRYEKAVPSLDWGPPGTVANALNGGKCNVTGIGPRPDYSTGRDYCAITPKIENVKVNGSNTTDITFTNSQFVKLSFNTKVDSQQLPLVMYGVDWGDGSNTMVTGVEMRDRPAESGLEETIYHLYSYWDLKANQSKLNGGCGADCKADGYCSDYTGAYCRIKPKIQIKDNWGWCNGITDSAGNLIQSPSGINVCSLWQNFGKWVVVKEK